MNLPAQSRNVSAIPAMSFFFAAASLISWLIFMKGNLGPQLEQKRRAHPREPKLYPAASARSIA